MESEASEYPHSSTDPKLRDDLKGRLAGLGITGPERDWVFQALYPPGPGTRLGMPAMTSYNALRYDYRNSVTIKAPAAVTNTWDLFLYCPPGDVTAYYWAAGPSGSTGLDFSTSTQPAGFASDWCGIVNTISMASSPVRYYTFNRNPAGVLSDGINLDTRLNPIKVSAFRTTYKSVTAHMSASDLYNGGMVTAAQVTATYGNDAGNFYRLIRDGTSTAVVLDTANIPLVDSEVVATVPDVYVAPAKHGVFLPLRLNNQTGEYRVASRSVGRTWNSTTTAATNGELFIKNANAPGSDFSNLEIPTIIAPIRVADFPWWMGSAITANDLPVDTAPDSVSTAVVIFRGLQKEASISVTFHAGFEFQLASGSPFGPMVSRPVPYSLNAMTAYNELSARMPSVYPARYNSLALLLPAARAALGVVAPHLMRLVPKAVEMVKQVVGHPVAQAIMPHVKEAVSVLNHPAPQIRGRPRARVEAKLKREISQEVKLARAIRRRQRKLRR